MPSCEADGNRFEGMQFDIAVIGGGIVGLATARELMQSSNGGVRRSLIVLEKEHAPATHQTGHNSGVIHSGIYYTPGSAKARNCRAGYEALIQYCDRRGIPYDLCGKVIVATQPEELPALDRIFERGRANGLSAIRKIGPERLHEIEPHARGLAAIEVPYAGIVNYRTVAEHFARDVEAADGVLAFNSQVTQLRRGSSRWQLIVRTPEGEREIGARLVINCAGLQCDRVAEAAGVEPDFRIIPFRGEYYELKEERRHLVRSLIYPVPDPAFPFLGVHFTTRIDGSVEAGPNAVFAFHREGYAWSDVSVRDLWRSLSWPGFRKVAAQYWRTGLGEIFRSLSKTAFTRALRRLVPEIQSDDLQSGGSGVRAQACAESGHLLDDFYIHESAGAIHLGNAPSPAATASLAIGVELARRAARHFDA